MGNHIQYQVSEHIWACSATKLYLYHCILFVNWAQENMLPWNLNQNRTISIDENVFENIGCKMSAILPWNRGGVTKQISSFLLISLFFSIVKTQVKYWISRLYLTGIAAAQLRTCMSNMDVIQGSWQVLLQERKICLPNGALVTPIPGP